MSRPRLPGRTGGSRPGGDDGTVLVLVLGLFGVLVVLVAVVVNVSVAVLAKRSVASAADGAAVSGAQGLDYPVFYARGPEGGVPLSPSEVAGRVAAYQETAQAELPGLLLRADVQDTYTAVVTATRNVELPFGGWLGYGSLEVVAQARARAPLAPP